MFEAGQQRLFPKPGLAREQLHTEFGMFDRIAGQRAALKDAPWRRTGNRGIASLAVATGEDELGNAIT
ncbi:hypothetical protein D3C75_1349890 [compost metagenome]